MNERVEWIDVHEGNALWMESYEYVVNQASGPLPLHRDLWLKSTGPLKARCLNARQLLDDGRNLGGSLRYVKGHGRCYFVFGTVV